MYLVTMLKTIGSQEIPQLKEVSHIRLRRSPTKSRREQKMKKCISWVRNKNIFPQIVQSKEIKWNHWIYNKGFSKASNKNYNHNAFKGLTQSLTKIKPNFHNRQNTTNINNKQTIETFQGKKLDINMVSCTRMSSFLLSGNLVKLFIYL